MANQKETMGDSAEVKAAEELSSIENKVQKNKTKMMWGLIAFLAVVAIILIWVFAIREPGKQAADNAIGQADLSAAMGNDSIALVQYKQVADNYGYDAGNRAALNTAILLFNNKEYEEALTYLKKYSVKESVIGAASKSLEGDCYVNLGVKEQNPAEYYNKAIDCYKEAVKISDNNSHYTPLFIMKEATVQRALKNYAAEAELYQTIQDKYPLFGAESGIEIDKLLKRAELQAGESK